MKQIVLDAGPLIGLFYAKDTYHQNCIDGIAELTQKRTALLTPLPIVFEVYKWLLQRNRPDIARRALRTMKNELQVLVFDEQAFGKVQDVIEDLPDWQGSLEDATVMLASVKYGCPIWTYNFRDFATFQSLEFWNPAG
ncbi:MAG: type II toxin-antitoxin system VapC family toxin [Cyanobacteria bacterium P01_D01_bin.36]